MILFSLTNISVITRPTIFVVRLEYNCLEGGLSSSAQALPQI